MNMFSIVLQVMPNRKARQNQLLKDLELAQANEQACKVDAEEARVRMQAAIDAGKSDSVVINLNKQLGELRREVRRASAATNRIVRRLQQL